uniref:GPI ethanolamine phosphate transferase 3 n=2 Tax=Macrostomum lignano TaxID=282301 RepID=A0A1I8IMZ9_9PLAT
MLFMPMFSYKMLWRTFTMGLPTRIMTLQLLLQFCIVLPLLCSHMPGSAYYIGDRRLSKRHTDAASLEARNFINRLSGSSWSYLSGKSSSNRKTNHGQNLSIGLLTSSADDAGCLARSAHALLLSANFEAKQSSGFGSLRVFICSDDGVVGSDLAAWGTALPVLGPRKRLQGDSKSNRSSTSARVQSQLWCLSAMTSADPHASWLAVLPGNYLAKLDSVKKLRTLIDYQTAQKSNRSPAVAILQTADSFTPGIRYFPPDPSSILELIGLAVCLAVLPYLVYYRKFYRPHMPMSNAGLAAFLAAQAVLTVLAVGRPNWHRLLSSLQRGHVGFDDNPNYWINGLTNLKSSIKLFHLFTAPILVSRSALIGIDLLSNDAVAMVMALLNRVGEAALVSVAPQLFDLAS